VAETGIISIAPTRCETHMVSCWIGYRGLFPKGAAGVWS